MQRSDWRSWRVVLLANAGLLAIGAATLSSVSVSARGPENGSPYAIFSNDGAAKATSADDGRAGERAIVSHSHKRSLAGQPVCVRLCDGAFFPLTSSGGHTGNDQEAFCGSLCPGAPTALYREPAGSDKIEDAVSAAGAPYTALPVALRFRTTLDRTCTCHRSLAEGLAMTRDPTLHKGDYVMTPNGFVVFEGSKQYPYSASDFASLTTAALPKAQRDLLTSLESNSLPNEQTSP
jgi:Protein of unknown function (DUF2865)